MTKITYADKVTLNENASVPAINKCQASDMNEIKSVVNAGITQTETNTNDIASLQQGWYQTGLNPTLTFVSFDSNTGIGIVSSNVDLTPYIGVGMWAKFTQSSAVKYAKITAISSTQLTFYMGTLYSINNSAITNTYFSMLKTPYGLPQELIRQTELINVFTGSSASGVTCQCKYTWQYLGKFKLMIVEVNNPSINGYFTVIFSYENLTNGNYLNQNAANTNIYSGNYLSDSFKSVHLIPANNIGTSTITFDGYGSPLVITRIFVQY